MSDENYVFLTGRVTQEPIVRQTPTGLSVVDLGIANNRYSRPNSAGERTQKTVFLRATNWDKGAEWIGEHISVGDLVTVRGVLVDDNYTDKETGVETKGRLKLDHCRTTLLRKKKVNKDPEDSEKPEVPSV